MLFKFKYFVIFFYLFSIYSINAEELKNIKKNDEIKIEDLIIDEEKLPLTLSNLIYLALERNLQTKQAFLNVKIAENELDVRKSVYYPSVSLEGSYYEIDGDYYSKREKIASEKISLSYNVFSFGKNSNKVKALKHYLNSVKYKEDQITQDIIYDVIENYYYLLLLKAKNEASIESEKASREAFNAASLKYKLGVVPLVDKLKSKNVYSKTKLSRIKNENDIKKQKASLNNLLNLNPDYILYVENPEINIKNINKKFEYYVKEALKNRLDLKQLKEEKQAKMKSLMAEKLSMMPSVNLSSYANISKNTTNSTPSYDENYIYLSVSIPLFSGFSTVNSIKILEKEVEIINLKIKEMEKNIKTEVWNVFYDFDTNQRSYFIAKDLLDTAKENAKVELGMYKNSKSSMLDVLNSQEQLESARYEFINSKYNLLIYRMKLLKTIGKMNLDNIINIDNL